MSDRSNAGLEVVVASSNKGKMREFKEILAAHDAHDIRLSLAPETLDVDETGRSYRANAYLKALQYALKYNSPALGDDSGLTVDALGGAPGLYSARFGGPGLTAGQRVDLLLEKLYDVPLERRTARFVCALCLVYPDGRRVEATGLVRGTIASEPRGETGFGYDPVFVVPRFSKTMAELTPTQKHLISHRGHAVANLLRRLRTA